MVCKPQLSRCYWPSPHGRQRGRGPYMTWRQQLQAHHQLDGSCAPQDPRFNKNEKIISKKIQALYIQHFITKVHYLWNIHHTKVSMIYSLYQFLSLPIQVWISQKVCTGFSIELKLYKINVLVPHWSRFWW